VEGVDAERVRLGDVARALDLVVEDGQHAAAGGLGRGGEADGVEQVEVGVGADRARRPHGAGEHHRARGFHREVQEIRRFLERRGAVRDHDGRRRGFYSLKNL
jgi:hypothetical protein